MRSSIVLASGLAALGVVAIAIVLLDLSFERAALLAPVLVVCAGAIVGLVLVWTKAALEPLRRRGGAPKPSDPGRTVAVRDGLDDQALHALSGADARGRARDQRDDR